MPNSVRDAHRKAKLGFDPRAAIVYFRDEARRCEKLIKISERNLRVCSRGSLEWQCAQESARRDGERAAMYRWAACALEIEVKE